MSEYLEFKKIKEAPRLPFEGGLDLTYRCNKQLPALLYKPAG